MILSGISLSIRRDGFAHLWQMTGEDRWQMVGRDLVFGVDGHHSYCVSVWSGLEPEEKSMSSMLC